MAWRGGRWTAGAGGRAPAAAVCAGMGCLAVPSVAVPSGAVPVVLRCTVDTVPLVLYLPGHIQYRKERTERAVGVEWSAVQCRLNPTILYHVLHCSLQSSVPVVRLQGLRVEHGTITCYGEGKQGEGGHCTVHVYITATVPLVLYGSTWQQTAPSVSPFRYSTKITLTIPKGTPTCTLHATRFPAPLSGASFGLAKSSRLYISVPTARLSPMCPTNDLPHPLGRPNRHNGR